MNSEEFYSAFYLLTSVFCLLNSFLLLTSVYCLLNSFFMVNPILHVHPT
jgi:hypothetical protein